MKRTTALLSVASLAAIGLSLPTSAIITRYLGPVGYGHYRVIESLFSLLGLVLSLGVFQAVQQSLISVKGDFARGLVAAALGFAVVASLVGTIIVIACLPLLRRLYSPELITVIPFALGAFALFLLQPCLEAVLTGTSRITSLAAGRCLPPILNLLILSAAWFAHSQLSLRSVYAVRIIAWVVPLAVISMHLRPALSHMFRAAGTLIHATREYGFHIYLGSLAGVASFHISNLMLGATLDGTSAGIYFLGAMMGSALAVIPSSVATSHFARFSDQPRISRKLLVSVGLATAGSYVMFAIAAKTVVGIVYPGRFGPASTLACLIGLGSSLHGLAELYNRFLCAHRCGKQVRNGAIGTGLVTVAAYGSLPLLLGLSGAVTASIAVDLTYAAIMFWQYRSFCAARTDADDGPLNPVVPSAKHLVALQAASTHG